MRQVQMTISALILVAITACWSTAGGAFAAGGETAANATISACAPDSGRVTLDYRDAAFRTELPVYSRSQRDSIIPEFIGPDLHGPYIFGEFDREADAIVDFVKQLTIRGDADGAFLLRADANRCI